jgi:hypothetical protein
METLCPHCGSKFAHGSCRDYFDTRQFVEFEDPAYFSVHHISVPCYLLQHNEYSREGWLVTRECLRRFLSSNSWPPAKDSRDHLLFDSGHRTWNFSKGAKPAGVETILWSWTIVDVRLDSAEHYCADVRRWGQSILDDSEDLVGRAGSLTVDESGSLPCRSHVRA